MKDKKIIVLIDAENTSAKFADGIIQYLEQQGDIISAQIYGDFLDNKNTKQWNGKAVEHNLQRYQADTTKAGKNAADIALVIDAMDFLHKENPADIFCIVTSDGDFTSLVERIRKEKIDVIGMGKEDSSPRLRRACSQYVELEKLIEKQNKQSRKKAEKKQEDNASEKKAAKKQESAALEKKTAKKQEGAALEKKTAKKQESDALEKKANKKTGKKEKNAAERKANKQNKAVSEKKAQKDTEKTKTERLQQDAEKQKTDKSKNGAEEKTGQQEKPASGTKPHKKEPLKNIKMALNELVQQDESSGKQSDLGGIKSRLQLRYPGFDEKNYGYSSIRELIDKETKFSVVQEGTHAMVVSDKKDGNAELENVCRFIIDIYPKKVIGKHEVAALGRKLRSHFPNFEYKSYGYKKLSTFLEEMEFTVY